MPLLFTISMANQPPTSPVIELLTQTAAVEPNDTMVARLRAQGFDLATLTVEVIVFGPLPAGATTIEPSGPPIARWTPPPLGGLSLEPTGDIAVRLPFRDGGDDGIRLPEPGVYPLTIRLTDDRETTASVETNIIRLPDSSLPAASPIPVAVVIEVGADGTISNAELAQLGRRLPATPLTAVVGRNRFDSGALAAEDTSDDEAAQDDNSWPRVVRTNPALDPSALAGIGLGDVYRGATGAALAEAEAVGLPLDRSTIVIDEPLTSDGAELLAELGFTTAILTEARSAVSAPWPASTGRLSTAIGSILVVRAEPSWPAEVLQGEGSAARRVQELLGLMALDETASSEGIVLAGFGALDDPAATLGLLLESLADTSLFNIESLRSDGFGRIEGLRELQPAPVARQNLASLTDELDLIEERLETYTSFHLEGPRSPAVYRQDLRQAFALELDAQARANAITNLATGLEAELGVISLPGNESVTLAARSASLPIAVESAASGSRRVRVTLRSDKITVVDPDRVITVPPGSSVIELDVETRSFGASPVSVSVLTPDGSRVLASTRFQVRSTAIPGLGLLLSAIGLALLGTWWYLSIRRKRAAHPSRDRSGRPKPSIDLRTDDGGSDTPTDRGEVTAGGSV